MIKTRLLLLPVIATLVGLAPQVLSAQQRIKTERHDVQVERVAGGLQNPWGLAFLPDGRMLVTERPGRIRLIAADGKLSEPLSGVPAVEARGQGGLLDIVLDPAFASNRLVYVSFAERREGGAATAVARMKLNEAATGFVEPEVIFRQDPVGNTTRHFGSRLVFDRTGALFIGLGDRGNREKDSQSRSGTIGKVVRIKPDGSVPQDNPGLRREGWMTSVWSLGHRNVQGAALHPVTGKLWTAEHGARGGDEINIPEAGKNYGWPVITYGMDYSGAKIGEGSAKAGMEQPVYHWDPSIAPSGMAFYTAERFPQWKGNVFVGALAGQMLMRLTLEGERVMAEERLFTGMNKRIRDVRQGPDGFLYLLTDAGDGEVLRIRPATP
jgi:aldose sugar dehydrogenase